MVGAHPRGRRAILLFVAVLLLTSGGLSAAFSSSGRVVPGVPGVHGDLGARATSPSSPPESAPSSVYSSLRQAIVSGDPASAQDVLTNTWSDLTVPNLPPPTAAASMAYDPARGATILFGGLNVIDQPTNWTWSYLSSNGRWTNLTAPGSPPARSGDGLAYDNVSGDLLLFGGSGSSATLGDCWVLPPAGFWQPCARSTQTPSARSSPALVSDPAMGGVLLYGGQIGANNLNDTWLWTAAGGWVELRTTGNAPRALWGMEGTALPGDEGVLLYGGIYTRAGGDSFYYQTYVLAPSGVWTLIASLPTPPSGMWAGSGLGAMAYVPALREVVLFGGAFDFSLEGETFASSQTWALPWGGPSPTWTQLPVQNVSAEFDMASAFDPTAGSLLIFGGLPSVPSDETTLPVQTQFAQFQARTNWTPALNDSAPPPLGLPSLAYDSSNGDILLFGGGAAINFVSISINETNQTWVLSPNGVWSEERPAVSPPARAGSVLEYLAPPYDEFVLFGGFSNVRVFNDTWTYRIGGSWVNVTGAAGPGGRASLAAAEVPGQAAFLLFGGVTTCGAGLPGFTTSRFLNDTWEYTPAGWRNLTHGTSPSVRAGSFLVPTITPGRYLLAGGMGPSAEGCTNNLEALNDTWSFDLTTDTWSSSPTIFNASATVFGCATYDVQEQEDLYAFGIAGVFLLTAGYSNDVWRSGPAGNFSLSTTWAEGAPDGRATAACVYDPLRDGTFVFGGIGAITGELYTILNSAWVLRDVAWGLASNTSNVTEGAPFALHLSALTAGGGIAERNATLYLEDSTGTISPSEVELVNGSAWVNATLKRVSASDSVEACGLGLCVNLTLSVVAPAVRLALSALPSSLSAGERTPLTVSLLGPTGQVVQGWNGVANLTVPGSRITPSQVTLANGVGTTVLQLFTAGDDLALWASADGLAAEEGPVNVTASFLAKLNLTDAPGTVYATGSLEATLLGWDAYGNPVSGEVVHLSDSLGDLVATSGALENGSASFSLAVGSAAGSDTVNAVSGNVSTNAPLRVVALPVVVNGTSKTPSPVTLPWYLVALLAAALAGVVLLLAFVLWSRKPPRRKSKGAGDAKAADKEREFTPSSSLLAFLPAEEEKKEEDDEKDEDE